MAKNDLRKLKDWDLQEKAAYTAQTLAADPARFAIDPADAADLAALAAELGGYILSVAAARAAFRAAVQGKDAVRGQTADLLARLGQMLYVNPALSPADIVDAGYAAHDPVRSAVGAFEPQSLIAQPESNGTVNLKWDRAGNAQGVTFVVEARREDGPWQMEMIATRSRIVLQGFPPGVPAWFRVYARSATRQSLASSPVAIYASQSQADLRAA